MSLQETPVANRLQIGFFGRCNSGKSTLINAFTSQEVTIVSPIAGTTTDVVQKNIELHGLGPCTLLDTAGFDDKSGELGVKRIGKTKHCAEKVDIAVIVFDRCRDWDLHPLPRNLPQRKLRRIASNRAKAQLCMAHRSYGPCHGRRH